MKKVILKYGLIASVIVVGIPVVSGILIGIDEETYAISEVIGYTTIVVALSTVFFAIRHYREHENGGAVSFKQGLKMGSLVSAMAGIAFAIYNLIFVLVIDPGFNEKYYAYMTNLERGSEAFQKSFSEAVAAQPFMFDPFFGTITMFLTVFVIGFIISVISSMILQSKQAV